VKKRFLKHNSVLSGMVLVAAFLASSCAVPVSPTPTPQPPSPTPTHTLAPTATPTPSPTPTPEPPIDVTPEPYTVVSVATDDVLNVRAQAGVAHSIVGTIPLYGVDVHVTGSGREVDGAVWVPIRYEDVTGWANGNYLARQVGSVRDEAAVRAAEIMMAIKDEDLTTLASLVHPDIGVRFSPYTYVRGEDLVFSAERVKDLLADQTVYSWGSFDGSGEPILFTFLEYYDRFIYDADFARPHVVGFNETIGMGNTINNIAEVYPQALTIEYHFEGFDPQFVGLDWRSLRLVLEEKEGAWYLVAVVHDEWTI